MLAFCTVERLGGLESANRFQWRLTVLGRHQSVLTVAIEPERRLVDVFSLGLGGGDQTVTGSSVLWVGLRSA